MSRERRQPRRRTASPSPSGPASRELTGSWDTPVSKAMGSREDYRLPIADGHVNTVECCIYANVCPPGGRGEPGTIARRSSPLVRALEEGTPAALTVRP